jgi:hypothetical protein
MSKNVSLWLAGLALVGCNLVSGVDEFSFGTGGSGATSSGGAGGRRRGRRWRRGCRRCGRHGGRSRRRPAAS